MINSPSLCCALLCLSSVSASPPLSWEELEREALDPRGRLESIFEIAEYGTRDQMVSALAADSEALNRLDGQGRSLLELARLGKNTRVLALLRNTARLQRAQARNQQDQIQRNSAGAQHSLPLAARAVSAIQLKDAAVLKQLIEEGFQVNGYYPFIKATPIEEAIKFDALDCLRLLVESGANWRVVSKREDHAKTMLMVATRYNRAEMVEYLIFLGAHPMGKGNNDATALHDACYYHSLDALRVLLPHYKEMNFSPWGSRNEFPLMLSLIYQDGAAQAIEIFAEAGFDPDHSMFSETPLIRAAKLNKLEAIKALLKAGASPKRQDEHGNQARDYASPEGREILDAHR